MRIDHIHIQNFRGIENLELKFQPGFNLLVGDNGSGKTSILSAVAVALGIWKESNLAKGSKQWRNIIEHEVREIPGMEEGGEQRFVRQLPVSIQAKVSVGARPVRELCRIKKELKAKTTDLNAKGIKDDILAVLEARKKQTEPLPLIAYYGAGRAWMPSNERESIDISGDLKARLDDGYYDCLNERIRMKDLFRWFLIAAARRDSSGEFKPAFEAVRLALQRSIPNLDEISWDEQKTQIVVTIKGNRQPFTNLSAGQKAMVSLVADMVVRAAALNAYLLGNGNGHSHPERLLTETPGVVLIDELDVHLHPKWQGQVIADLRATFPKVQFICSSHSALLIQDLRAEEILRLDGTVPSDWEGENSVEDILEEIQDVREPQSSRRALEARASAEEYFALLRQDTEPEAATLAQAELRYRNAQAPYADDPTIQAILKLEAMAKVVKTKKP